MIYYYPADANGYDSIADVLEKHKAEIVVTPLNSYETFDNHTAGLLGKIKPGDTVILDTISSFAATVRGDLKIGNDPTQSYWSKRENFMGDSTNRNAYDAAGQLILRRLRDLKNAGANIIVTAHESEREDNTVVPPSKKRAPDVNAALLSGLVLSSSDVVRLKVNPEAVLGADGNIKLPARSRVVELGPSDEILTKVHVPLAVSAKLPSAISRPSLPKLRKVLGKTPTWLTIYAPPGAGKSTLVLSDFLDPEGKGLGI